MSTRRARASRDPIRWSALNTIARVATGGVAALHVWFFALETLLWRSELARKSLGMTPDEAEATAVMAGNQGVYNLAFAAGLALGLATEDARGGATLRRFFLVAIVGVGVYGAISARFSILFIQVVPAVVALGLSELARARGDRAPPATRSE